MGHVFSHTRGLEKPQDNFLELFSVFSHTRGLEMLICIALVLLFVFSHTRGLETTGFCLPPHLLVFQYLILISFSSQKGN